MSLTETKTTKTVERRKRGIFGWFWFLAFWGFQAFMILFTIINLGAWGEVTGTAATACVGEEYSSACEAGTVIGATLGAGMVATFGWFAWFLGTIVLGLMMLFTRGAKVTTYVEKTA